jgi:hypothetical protein
LRKDSAILSIWNLEKIQQLCQLGKDFSNHVNWVFGKSFSWDFRNS